jgi:hypothetical protein
MTTKNTPKTAEVKAAEKSEAAFKEVEKTEAKPEERSLGQSIRDVFKSKAKPSPVTVVEKEGHAVVSTDLPARTVETSVAYSAIPGCAVAAVEAWERVRHVEGGDAPFADCLPQFRQELINSAEAIYRGSQPSAGETTQAKYEREVAKIRSRQEDAKAKAAVVAA